MLDLFYQTPTLSGGLMAATAAIELGFLVFSFERYRAFFRRHRWINLLFQESESRAVLISSSVLFFTIGLALVGAEAGWLSKSFWLTACALAFINFAVWLVRDKRRRATQLDNNLDQSV
jgi:hypothetical protein